MSSNVINIFTKKRFLQVLTILFISAICFLFFACADSGFYEGKYPKANNENSGGDGIYGSSRFGDSTYQ